jgi:hypothetical protein
VAAMCGHRALSSQISARLNKTVLVIIKLLT